MPRLFKSLFFQVVMALALGIALGMAHPDAALQMKPLGDGFIKLIKMIIAPFVFCVVVHGIATAGDLSRRSAGSACKSIVYFEVVTTIALVLGIVVAYCLRPGARDEHRPEDARRQSALRLTARRAAKDPRRGFEFLINIIPSTFVGAFANGDILQVLVSAVLFGAPLSLCGERAQAGDALHRAS